MVGSAPFAVLGLRGRGAEEMRTFRFSPGSKVVCLVRAPFWKFGVEELLGRSWDSSSIEGVEGSVSFSLSGGRKPMPGVSGVWTPGVLEVWSLFRRQESARTPARRIMVPRAIYATGSAKIEPVRVWEGCYQKARKQRKFRCLMEIDKTVQNSNDVVNAENKRV